MSTPVDLNRLRQTLISNQQRHEIVPASEDRKIRVDRDGQIVIGRPDHPQQERELSEVHQGVFYLGGGRLERDRRIALEKLPRGTQFEVIDGVAGWFYTIYDEFQQPYTMFLYFDGSLYQVKVVFPEVEGKYSVHDCHLFADGRICLREPDGGLESLEQAYAKSAVWATGFTVYQQVGQFPFSANNI